MKKFVLASKNKSKAAEIKEILGSGFEIITQSEAGADKIDVVEDGGSFEENAAKKAEQIMQALNMPVIADDSGLCVDCLNGAPGIYTARYAGENASDDDNISKLLSALEGVPAEQRGAKFVCVIALAEPGKPTRFFRGETIGRIAEKKSGCGGFGYDPVFYKDEFNATMAEISPEEKNKISHRGAALRAFRNALCNE